MENNRDKRQLFIKIGIMLLSALIIYIFRDSKNDYRLVPLLFLLIFGSLLIHLLLELKPKLDKILYKDYDALNTNELAQKASLAIKDDGQQFEIKHYFRIQDYSTIGILIILSLSLFFCYIGFTKTSGLVEKIIVCLISLPLIIFSVLSMLRQFFDGLRISNKEISVCYYLKSKKIALENNSRIKMDIERSRIKRSGKLPSEFITITHSAFTNSKWTKVLSFQMKLYHEKNAIRLGKEIKALLLEKIKEC